MIVGQCSHWQHWECQMFCLFWQFSIRKNCLNICMIFHLPKVQSCSWLIYHYLSIELFFSHKFIGLLWGFFLHSFDITQFSSSETTMPMREDFFFFFYTFSSILLRAVHHFRRISACSNCSWHFSHQYNFPAMVIQCTEVSIQLLPYVFKWRQAQGFIYFFFML